MSIPDRDITQVAADDPDLDDPAPEGIDDERPADPDEEPTTVSRGLEVDEFDAIEQAQVVPEEDDDYGR